MNEIRALRSSDLDEVINIWLEASIKAHDFVEESFWKSKSEDMRSLYIPSSETYVIEKKGSICGFLSLHENTLAALFVLPSEQGKGMGKKLITRAKQLRKQLTLTVYKENSRSLLFYKKNGFEIIQEQVDGHTGYPEVFMSWNS